MKPVLSALCMLALIPVATSASEVPATENSLQAQCLQKAAAARAADYAHQTRLNRLATERMGAMGNTSFGSAAVSRPVGSWIRPSLVAVSTCDALEEKQAVAAQRTSDSRPFRVTRGGVIWKNR